MRGHTRKRQWTDKDGNERAGWEYTIELGEVAGERQRRTHGGFRTKRAATDAMQKEIQAHGTGTYVKPASVSLADYLSYTWLPMIEQTRRATTHDLYRRMVRLDILPALGALPLQAIGPRDVEGLYLALAKHGRKDGGPLGARSLHNVATVLHKALEHAVDLELLSRNPAARVSPPKGEDVDEGEPRHWTAQEVGAFLDRVDALTVAGRTVCEQRRRRNGTTYTYARAFAPDPMQRALWYLSATTGMRRGEVCGLRWGDLDLEAGELSVRRARVAVGGKVVESAPKTKRGRRVIALDPGTVDVLRVWRRQQLRERLRYGTAWEDSDEHVFTHCVYFTQPPRYGVPVRPDWVTTTFHKLVADSELPALHLHGLRHSWATAALEAGEHLRNVADQLGHADTAVTDRTYTHTVQARQDRTALRVAELIASKRAGAR